MTMMPKTNALTANGIEVTQQRQFFEFSGSYCVAQQTTTDGMASDAASLLECAEAMTQRIIDCPSGNLSTGDQAILFGIKHFITMAKNLCESVQSDLEQAAVWLDSDLESRREIVREKANQR